MYKKTLCLVFAVFFLSITSSFAEEKAKLKKEEITYSITVNKDFETVVNEIK
ncbi:MAG: hypothetical protein HZA05_04040, partial [Nitrospirae bacterium]|nr:hypothetical protein [Nitrospirota bacterium]